MWDEACTLEHRAQHLVCSREGVLPGCLRVAQALPLHQVAPRLVFGNHAVYLQPVRVDAGYVAWLLLLSTWNAQLLLKAENALLPSSG